MLQTLNFFTLWNYMFYVLLFLYYVFVITKNTFFFHTRFSFSHVFGSIMGIQYVKLKNKMHGKTKKLI